MIASRSTSWTAPWSLRNSARVSDAERRRGRMAARKSDSSAYMFPTPLNSFWFSSALLMGVLRRRKRVRNRSICESSGSSPGAANPVALLDSIRATASLPKRRGSTKRSSRPEASFRTACVCFAISVSGTAISSRPVMPRCTINCPRVVDDLRPFRVGSSRSKTMCLPTRRTCSIRARSNTVAISFAGDFSGSGFSPNQTDSTTSPATRRSRPRAMVSTSGSSGTASSLRQAEGPRMGSDGLGFAPPRAEPVKFVVT